MYCVGLGSGGLKNVRQRQHYSPDPVQDQRPGFPPELTLLLSCLRWPQRPQDIERIRAAASIRLDWPLFLRLSLHHRVVPLVSHNLHAALGGSPSGDLGDVLAELKQLSTSSAHRALRCLAELRRVVQELQSRGIVVRVLKGMPLAQSVFGDLGLRSAGDIDLLIEEGAILETDRTLRELGYSGSVQVQRFSPRRLQFYRAHWKDVVYDGAGTGFEVDIHWRCFRNSAMPGTGLCATPAGETVSFGGFRVQTLPRTESLLYLCVHGTLDGWLYLKSLADVAAQVSAMSGPELDNLAAQAERYGILPEFTATMVLVRRYLGMDNWSALLLPAGNRAVRGILRYSDRVLVDGGFLAERDSIPIGSTLAFELGLRPALRYRFELLLRVLFRVRMWETVPLPDFLFGLYPLLSPFEWAIHRLRLRWEKPASSGTLAT